MNTKTFAQESRKILMQGVAKKLLYWGFDEKGAILEQPEKVSGGYSFRGDVFDDPSVPNLWHSLQVAIKNKGVEVVIEEAAYTWFNRIMALRILVKNGYEEPQLEDTTGLEHTPVILQKARQGKSDFLNADEKKRLQNILTDYSKDQEAFAILIKGYCHSHKTLQRVFGKIDDYTELLLPDNMLQTDGFLHLLNTTDAISDEDYQKVELIGWLYQFYISEKKDEVFASFKKKKKAEAKDIPAATQIFTPNWIVKYMVENTAGKTWLDKHPNSALKSSMKYLVTNDNNEDECLPELVEGHIKEALINNVEDLTLIDPAAGSGHILVEGFDLIYKMYLEEYYTPEEAVESILKNNLFGLDIDDRAAQLATFAILLKAAKVYPSIWKKDWLPNVYAMPEDQLQNWFTTKDYDFSGDWLDLQGMQLAAPITVEWSEIKKNKDVKKKVTFKEGNVLNEKVVDILRDHNKLPITVDFSKELELFWGDFEKPYNYADFFYAMQLLRQGKNLGSVIKCNINIGTRTHIETTYNNWLEREKVAALDIEEIAILNTLKNYIPVLILLTKKYTSVVANPPYMGQKNMNAALKNYVNANYPLSKSDLFAVFMESTLAMNVPNGFMGMINQHSWMFKTTYKKLRSHILNNYQILNMLHLGPRTFEELSGEVVQSTAFVLKNEKYLEKATYYRLVDYKNINLKEEQFFNKENKYSNIPQSNFFNIPSNPIAYWATENVLNIYNSYESLTSICDVKTGMQTGNNDQFLRCWYEIDSLKSSLKDGDKWFPYNKGGGSRRWYGQNELLVNWENDGKLIRKHKSSVIRNSQYYFKDGLTWSTLSSSDIAFRSFGEGYLFDTKGSCIFLIEDYNILPYLNSKVFNFFLSIQSPTLDFSVGDVANVPFKQEDVNIFNDDFLQPSKKDWDSRETSWDFEQSPLLNKANTLESAYATWEEDVRKSFFQLHKNEEELNRIFIDIYGLQDELTPEVTLKDITILQEELAKKDLEKLEVDFRENGNEAIALPINQAEVISQFISYAIGLFMGRYRLDKKGLNIAHPNPTAEELQSYTYNNGNITIDEDAILPIMGTACNFPDDALQQIYSLLDAIWGAGTRTENINFIQECLNKELEKFLVADFYKYHCKKGMYNKKPIYWLFSSKKGAFQVLVYMHRMNAFTVEKIRDNYLLEHIKNIVSEITLLENNEANLNTQEAKKLEQLRKNRDECYEYEAELKTVADNQITFDLDDGVTVNYKKFETVLAKIK
ncbi:BREX-1 system adenine-specific DNA-methyltransferase PglX [Polaribacter sp. Z014]|uniref:BREX-1 system adenine-specific DNA-methyltransferase PglX n=1 Tax=Polaribacter sp. Z014 TaxID=2927126 RepID=UPI00202076B5|nr:BREX-1 system adenine-specific DNA-methyltransferase PglX [Polaribacter sp. Z014]MCL7762667.1 BREX-1 system adenine-specific DNA-methyltransferase PglX [Polaribacter sp. Z014]